jgi:hypothetical protein
VVVAVVVTVGAADGGTGTNTVTRDVAEVDVAVGSGLVVEEDRTEVAESVEDGKGMVMRLVAVTTTTVVSAISNGAVKLFAEKMETEWAVELKASMVVFRSVRTL